MVDLYAANGGSTDEVTTETNKTGVMDPILKVNPDRGTFLRFFNYVSKGSASGLPLYFKLKDSNGNDLPQNTDLQLQAQVAGMNGWMNVSELVQSINYWNTNSLTTQRDKDNVDNVKVDLTHPEASGNAGTRESVDVRDIDTLAVAIDSAAQVDWNKCEFYFDSEAVQEYSRG